MSLSQSNPSESPNIANAVPRIVYGEGVDPSIVVSPEEKAESSRALGRTDEAIANSAIYLDPKPRLLNKGTHYPNWLGRRRFSSVPELQDVKGDIVRISTVMRDKHLKPVPRSAELMNKTSVHEDVHAAQAERNDRNVKIGWGIISAATLAGATMGHNAGDGRGALTRGVMTASGAFVGYMAGYRVAPHERQARKTAGQVLSGKAEVTTRAITRKS
ncbi:MAG: hypothetical protein WCO19_01330 [Candidatus Saccharibacteria bacterium]